MHSRGGLLNTRPYSSYLAIAMSRCPALSTKFEGNTVTCVLVKPERNFTTHFAQDLIYAQSSIYVIVVTHAMTQDAQTCRHEFRTRDSVVRSTQKLGISDLHHMEKVMRAGDRERVQFISVLCERKREKEIERERASPYRCAPGWVGSQFADLAFNQLWIAYIHRTHLSLTSLRFLGMERSPQKMNATAKYCWEHMCKIYFDNQLKYSWSISSLKYLITKAR